MIEKYDHKKGLKCIESRIMQVNGISMPLKMPLMYNGSIKIAIDPR